MADEDPPPAPPPGPPPKVILSAWFPKDAIPAGPDDADEPEPEETSPLPPLDALLSDIPRRLKASAPAVNIKTLEASIAENEAKIEALGEPKVRPPLAVARTPARGALGGLARRASSPLSGLRALATNSPRRSRASTPRNYYSPSDPPLPSSSRAGGRREGQGRAGGPQGRQRRCEGEAGRGESRVRDAVRSAVQQQRTLQRPPPVGGRAHVVGGRRRARDHPHGRPLVRFGGREGRASRARECRGRRRRPRAARDRVRGGRGV